MYFPMYCMVTLPTEVASSFCSLKLHPLVCINDCISISWFSDMDQEHESLREKEKET